MTSWYEPIPIGKNLALTKSGRCPPVKARQSLVSKLRRGKLTGYMVFAISTDAMEWAKSHGISVGSFVTAFPGDFLETHHTDSGIYHICPYNKIVSIIGHVEPKVDMSIELKL